MNRVKQEEINKIPKLPRGQGSIYVSGDKRYIIYKKTVGGKRLEVQDVTVRAVKKKMKEKEKTIQDGIESKNVLHNKMCEWLFLKKRLQLKPSSFDRLETTINNQIRLSNLGQMRYKQISSYDIQGLINSLNDEKKSWSTIKKAYDALNDFYRDVCIEEKFDNPMLTVKMISKENTKTKTKRIEFLNESNVEKFIREATRLTIEERPYYPLGYAYASIIFTGLRAGEMSALRWRDIDFDNDIISVTKTVEKVKNRDFDESNKELMREMGIKRYTYAEGSTKTYANRYVYMNKEAKKMLLMQYEYSNNPTTDSYVIGTREGNPNNPSNMSKTIGIIEKNAGIDIKSDGVHVLRHTCASSLFRNEVPIQYIADMLGNSVDVCQSTYVHFVDEQRRKTASKARYIIGD